MVITVQEDGWGWGKEELANPLFCIVKIPGMTVVEGSVFTGNLINPQAIVPDITNPLRSFKVDVDHPLISSQVTVKGDSVRPKAAIALTKAEITSLKSAVTISNAAVIG